MRFSPAEPCNNAENKGRAEFSFLLAHLIQTLRHALLFIL